jgi:DNA-binding CsgD family transcriptional regulator
VFPTNRYYKTANLIRINRKVEGFLFYFRNAPSNNNKSGCICLRRTINYRWSCVCAGAQRSGQEPFRPATTMLEAEELSWLIASVYDAALDQELWPGVLQQTCRHFNCMMASLASYDLLNSSANMDKTWGYDPQYLRSYLDHYVKINPMIPASMRTSVGDVLTISQLMPYEEWLACTAYREWAKPQGIIDGIQATLEKTGTAMAFLAIGRHENVGLVDERMRRGTELLWPHFRRAVLIGKVLNLQKVEVAVFGDTLDGLAAALFLVDANGRISFANAAGRAMLSDADVVTSPHGFLATADAQADRRLREVFAAAGAGDAALKGGGIAVPLTARSGAHYVAHVLPLTSGSRRAAGINYAAVAAVFVRGAALDMGSIIEAMGHLYGLTPAERRALQAVIDVGGVARAGSTLGISEATVKTHLQHIFEKTGTRSQIDLVKLVAGHASPISE